MSDHLTEEEQVEALKRWWKENGKWIVAAVVLSVGGYFGWGAWQDQQHAQAVEASTEYEELLSRIDSGDALGDLADQIQETSGDSLYAYNAAFLQAKTAVEAGDLEAAETHLSGILEKSPDAPVELLAQLRLARVLAAQDKFEQAFDVLQSAEPTDALASEFAEVRGDLLARQGDDQAARAAYQAALDALSQQDQRRASLLGMKLDNLKTAVSEEPNADEEGSAS